MLDRFRELGINGFHIKGYGSPATSLLDSMLLFFEISKYDGSVGLFFLINAILGMSALDILGSEEQKQKILPQVMKLEKFMSYGLTEPLKGSEAITLDTTARKVEGGYLINGAKRWIGNGAMADYFLIWATNVNDNNKVQGFIMEKGDKGFEVQKMV